MEEGENASYAQLIQDPIHTRDGQLAESADVVELLVVS